MLFGVPIDRIEVSGETYYKETSLLSYLVINSFFDTKL